MSFIAAGEILGATATVRTLTIAHHPKLPEAANSLVDAYCTGPGCDCRKAMIFVYLDNRPVSILNFGWESPASRRRSAGQPRVRLKRPRRPSKSPLKAGFLMGDQRPGGGPARLTAA